MPDSQVAEGKVTYADADRSHPLGRRILLGDAGMGSSYRIQDGNYRSVAEQRPDPLHDFGLGNPVER